MNLQYITHSICFVLFNVLIISSTTAQLHVNDSLSVGVGTNEIYDAKMRILTDSTYLEKGLEVISQRETGSTNGLRYGIYNLFENSSNSRRAGFYNEANHFDATDSGFRFMFGIRNIATTLGRGALYGIHNAIEGSEVNNGTTHMRGIFTSVSGGGNGGAMIAYSGSVDASGISNCIGASMSIRDIDEPNAGALSGYTTMIFKNQTSTNSAAGMRNTIQSKGNGDKYGVYNRIYHDDVASTDAHYGIYNQLEVNDEFGSPHLYGSFNNLKFFNNIESYNGEQYGVFGNINDANSSPVAYGIYGSAPTTNDASQAGYFNGNVKVTGVLMQTSDERLKTNIELLTNATELINQLQPKTYEFNALVNDNVNLPTGKQFGFLAQELELVIPELVADITHGGNLQDVTREVTVYDDSIDEDGNPIEPEARIETITESKIVPATESYKSINYTALIPILVQGIKEQQAQIAQQQAEIDELKRMVDILNGN